MKLSQKAKKSLLAVAKHIEDVPERFDMGSWARAAKAGKSAPECGTVACIAGWLNLRDVPSEKLAKYARSVIALGDDEFGTSSYPYEFGTSSYPYGSAQGIEFLPEDWEEGAIDKLGLVYDITRTLFFEEQWISPWHRAGYMKARKKVDRANIAAAYIRWWVDRFSDNFKESLEYYRDN